jgi:cold shock CspA family protein
MSNNTDTQTKTDREQTPDPERDYIGYVKWFDDSKGYGFVRILTPGDRYENDVFVHQSNVHPQRSTYRTLRESEAVRFNLSVETDASATPQVVELVGVNGRLYCDSRVRRRRGENSGDGEGESNAGEGTGENWQEVNTGKPTSKGRGRGRPRKSAQ